MFPVLAVFVSAGPLTCMMNMKKGFGSAAALPLLWFVVNRLMGEIGMYVTRYFYCLQGYEKAGLAPEMRC